jgi:hypothetical protein
LRTSLWAQFLANKYSSKQQCKTKNVEKDDKDAVSQSAQVQITNRPRIAKRESGGIHSSLALQNHFFVSKTPNEKSPHGSMSVRSSFCVATGRDRELDIMMLRSPIPMQKKVKK